MLSPIFMRRTELARPPRDAVDRARRKLEAALGASKIDADPARLLAYGGDESENDAVAPDLAVLATSAEDVAAALRVAREERVPITPRAGGSGKSGGAIPVAGGIALATAGLCAIKEIDRKEHVAVVEPGVILGDLHRAVEAEGLFYPPDANSLEVCALGGNVAENAAGPRALKYGPTRDYVTGLELALVGGEKMFVGRRTKKGVTGYDLAALVVGSEGTLAVVTEITLRLLPKPEKIRTLLALFSDVREVSPAVTAMLEARVVPRCVELLDRRTLDAVRKKGVGVDARAGAMLVVEVDGSEAACDADMERVGGACSSAGALDVLVAQDEAQRERLWSARRSLSHATRAMARHKVSEDVVVPRSAIGVLLERVDRIRESTGIDMLTYGHAGDGNLHVNFLWNDDDAVPRVEAGLAALFRAVVELRGTLTGEHGVGLSKQPYLRLEQSDGVIDLQRRLKATFDPDGLLNPGKIFPKTTSHGGC
ncbi:MAG TPA: FAD-linked oxidase C-terminal domain-containing protein [Polyangiaceae bacterium]|nr:FAD-linked oxidase C-terminal domain-containing protein [Polyangiaceae bacterium]